MARLRLGSLLVITGAGVLAQVPIPRIPFAISVLSSASPSPLPPISWIVGSLRQSCDSVCAPYPGGCFAAAFPGSLLQGQAIVAANPSFASYTAICDAGGSNPCTTAQNYDPVLLNGYFFISSPGSSTCAGIYAGRGPRVCPCLASNVRVAASASPSATASATASPTRTALAGASQLPLPTTTATATATATSSSLQDSRSAISTITILNASYGLNCNPALANGYTSVAAAFCAGSNNQICTIAACVSRSCNIFGGYPVVGDPAIGCAKDLSIYWRCTRDAPGFVRLAYVPPEANGVPVSFGCITPSQTPSPSQSPTPSRASPTPSGLPVSYGDACGPVARLQCGNGYGCCSQYGWCGNDTVYCGPGCQGSVYGDPCYPLPPSPSPAPSGLPPTPTSSRLPSPLSNDGSCGPSAAGAICPPEWGCCSLYGWCGTDPSYCGTGCQAAYGACTTPTPSASPSPPPPSASPSAPPSASRSLSQSASPTVTASPTASLSRFASPSSTNSLSLTPSPTISVSQTPSASPARPSPSSTPTPSSTARPMTTSVTGRVIAPGTVVYNCSKPGVVALTFDDGPYIYTQAILDMFNAAGMKVTFFQNSNNWDCQYNSWQTIRNIDATGHQLASHTFSHADLTSLTQAAVSSQLQMQEPIWKNIIGKVPLFMRPPYGFHNAAVDATLASLGYVVVIWSVDSLDSAGATFAQEQVQYNTMTNGGSGHTVLNHDVQVQTFRNLTAFMINWVRSRNLRAVTVGECLGVTEMYRDYTTPMSAVQLSAATCPPIPRYTPTPSVTPTRSP